MTTADLNCGDGVATAVDATNVGLTWEDDAWTRPAGGGLRVSVTAVRDIAERVREITFSAVGPEPLPTWTPGAHVNLMLAPGLSRSYSLCSAPDEPFWRIAVLEEPNSRGGSRFVHQRLRVGDELDLVGPSNNFPLQLRGRRVIFVAGGIGVTPIVPMVAAADLARADWRLVHLSRSRSAATYLDEFERYGDKVLAHVDTDGGIIDLPTTLDVMGGPDADIYACGPGPLLGALEEYAVNRPGARLYLERFANEQPLTTEADHAFVVETADGTEIAVAADQTMLEALSGAGIRILSSCQEGVCGTCETAVLEGTPDHRDAFLTEEERASGSSMMVCVSRCKGERIVLDV